MRPRRGPLQATPVHGGVALEVRAFGPGLAFARLWVVCPFTHAERVVFVRHDGELPAPGDDLWWAEGYDVQWTRRACAAPPTVLAAIGVCFDPQRAKPDEISP